jgi:hypothetical protein
LLLLLCPNAAGAVCGYRQPPSPNNCSSQPEPDFKEEGERLSKQQASFCELAANLRANAILFSASLYICFQLCLVQLLGLCQGALQAPSEPTRSLEWLYQGSDLQAI